MADFLSEAGRALENRHPALILLNNYFKNLSIQVIILLKNGQIFIFNFVLNVKLIFSPALSGKISAGLRKIYSLRSLFF